MGREAWRAAVHGVTKSRTQLRDSLFTHSSIFTWRIPWAEEPGRLQSMVSQSVGHDTDKLFFMNLEIRGHSKKAVLFK